MIRLVTDCNTCIHKDICRYINNSKADMIKLKNMNYGEEPNNDYNWETISNSHHVNITFSCPDYRNGQTAIERR